jgi:SAM-dependent methyltransferase
LPFADGSLNAVCCFDVLEHLARPEECLAEVFRTLGPGGMFFMSVPNPASWGAHRKGQESFIYRDPTHCSIRAPQAWQAALAAAGLHQVWAGTDGLWDPPYLRHIPSAIQWPIFVGATQIAWLLAPGFPWQHGENFTWLGRRL